MQRRFSAGSAAATRGGGHYGVATNVTVRRVRSASAQMYSCTTRGSGYTARHVRSRSMSIAQGTQAGELLREMVGRKLSMWTSLVLHGTLTGELLRKMVGRRSMATLPFRGNVAGELMVGRSMTTLLRR